MIPWEFDNSEPIINPHRMLAYHGERLGGNPGELALPDLLVGTFQYLAFEHLAGRLGDEMPGRWPSAAFWPLARGSLGGRTMAAVRLPIGASAAAIALELAIAAGVRTVLLVGSAGSLQPHLPLGSLVIPTRALRCEGTSHYYLPAGRPSTPSAELVDALVSVALRRGLSPPILGPAWTTDAPYRECSDAVARFRAEGILVVEMEAAALFAVASHRGARAALIVAVSDELREPWSPGFHTLAYRRALLTAVDVVLEAAAGLPTWP